MIDLEQIIASYGDDDLVRYVALADYFLVHEAPSSAAVALDRAFGLAPHDAHLARQRAAILGELAVREHGLLWRYVPAGTFLMGSLTGDPDERPVHPRTLGAFWITDAPITWARYCELVGWSPPPLAAPPIPAEMTILERIHSTSRGQVRLSYCASIPPSGTPPPSGGPSRYDHKPMVAVSVDEAELLAARLNQLGPAHYALPTEAQWEKAARGGRVGARYAWGDEPPTRGTCDFDMEDFRLRDPRELPGNGYGLHGMCGGVAEWTADVYDALAYHRAASGDLSPISPPAPERVLRGGAWTDCADAVTVSHRMSRGVHDAPSPTIGFRLVRTVAPSTP